jgi:hypothetical protein
MLTGDVLAEIQNSEIKNAATNRACCCAGILNIPARGAAD